MKFTYRVTESGILKMNGESFAALVITPGTMTTTKTHVLQWASPELQ